MSDSVDVYAVLNSEEAPQVEETSEVVVEEVSAPASEEPVAEPEPVAAPEPEVEEEVPVVPSTQEVVQNVQEMLTTDPPTVKTTEEKLNQLIELLKSTSRKVEYDDNEFTWVGPLVKIREDLDQL